MTHGTQPDTTIPLIVVCGVSGSGKSTIGALLAARLSVPFIDGDALHPAENVAKMSAGTPLDDDDRRPWLDRIADEISAARESGTGLVVACSALKSAYREVIRRGADDVFFAQLLLSADVLLERVSSRPGHFMPAALVPSQLAALEPLAEAECGVELDAAAAPDDLVAEIIAGHADSAARDD
ncbi:gluconokinase [Agromyces subbeticus]|uniref:gluconokinase n=1 Tax=Agromyces subbeticus TaxID=293890 RepID=UPI00041A0972|nr:gluconokinase [Agromyces subbeticus]